MFLLVRLNLVSSVAGTFFGFDWPLAVQSSRTFAAQFGIALAPSPVPSKWLLLQEEHKLLPLFLMTHHLLSGRIRLDCGHCSRLGRRDVHSDSQHTSHSYSKCDLSWLKWIPPQLVFPVIVPVSHDISISLTTKFGGIKASNRRIVWTGWWQATKLGRIN